MVDMAKIEYKCIASASVFKKTESESNDSYYKRIKKMFLDCVFKNTYNFKNKKIRFDKSKNNGIDVECFYHTITSKDSEGNPVRSVDIERYQKCNLVFTILDICTCNHIQCTLLTIKPDPANDNRISIYCEKFHYVIILEEKNCCYDYITAFPVSENNIEKYS